MRVNDIKGVSHELPEPAQYMSSQPGVEVTAPPLNKARRAVVRALMGGLRWIVRRQARHTLWLELRGMSDHTLRDFGISRRGIDDAVDAAIAGRPVRSTRTAASRPRAVCPIAANADNLNEAA